MAKDKRRKPSIAELHKLAAGAMKKATTLAERNAQLLKRLAELNEKIAAHTDELARRRGPGSRSR